MGHGQGHRAITYTVPILNVVTTPDVDDAGPGQPTTVSFADGLPGFPEAHNFALEALEGLEPFMVMRSLEIGGLEFVVIAPAAAFPDYVIDIPDSDVEHLGLTEASDAVVLVIVTVARPPTANLLGPVVINRHTHAARQVVLANSRYQVAVPLPG